MYPFAPVKVFFFQQKSFKNGIGLSEAKLQSHIPILYYWITSQSTSFPHPWGFQI